MTIKNIIFDVGNVLVKWAPHEVIQQVFPEQDPVKLYENMFPIWLDLNLGKLSEYDAIIICRQQLNVSETQMSQLMHGLKTSQTPLPGSVELLEKLHTANIPLYSITDNIKEFIEYHHNYSNFLHYFKGIIVSADIGVLKPNKAIYKHLLEKYELNPVESVFIDDCIENVQGAISAGMHAFQFTDAESCERKLRELGVLP